MQLTSGIVLAWICCLFPQEGAVEPDGFMDPGTSCDYPAFTHSLERMFEFHATSPAKQPGHATPSVSEEEAAYERYSQKFLVDVSTPQGVHQFACRLAEVRSLEDLADVVGLSLQEVEFGFQQYHSLISEVGGVFGLWELEAAYNDLTTWIQRSNYPDVPLSVIGRGLVTDDEVRQFFANFREKYYDYFETLEQMSARIAPVDYDPTYLGGVFTKSQSRAELARALGYRDTVILDRVELDKPFYNDMRGYFRAKMMVLAQLVEWGWMDLTYRSNQ